MAISFVKLNISHNHGYNAPLKSDSTSNVSVNLYGNSAWYICEGFHLTCIIFNLYLFYALMHHQILRIKRRKLSGARYSRKGGEWLEKLCIIGILAAMLRFVNNQILLFTGWTSTNACTSLLNVSIALYFIAIHPVYFFLWVRQRIFYSNRALKHLYSKTVRFLSWVALACFVFTTILFMVMFVADQKNSASGRVCRYNYSSNGSIWNEDTFLDETRNQGVRVNTIAGLVGGIIQGSFLALYLYPIMDNKLRAMRTRHMRSRNVIFKLIRRSFLLAGLCILTDVAIALLVKKVHGDFPEAIFAPLAMYDVNLIINLICIIATFRNWQVMLFPWFYGLNSFKRKDTTSILNRSSFRHQGETAPKLNNCQQAMLELDLHVECKDECIVHKNNSNNKAKKESVHLSVETACASFRKCSSDRAKTESLVTDHNQNVEYEIHYHSDPTYYHNELQSKRSKSLILISNVSLPSLRKTRSHFIVTLLSKSKSWLLDHKPF